MGISSRPRIVIVGAGFAGLAVARTLAASSSLAAHYSRFHVLLLDRHNYHTFSPLLYRVGTSEFEPGDVAFPLKRLFKQSNVVTRVGEVEGVDLEAQTINTEDGTISYDYLVLALGTIPHLSAIPGAADSAFPINTVEQGIALRNQILRCLERAAHATDAVMMRYLLTFAIVGGGVAGIEFAGALADFVHSTIPREYPDLATHVRLMLIESGPRLGPELPQKGSAFVQSELSRRGVQVLLNSRVREITGQGVYLDRDLLIPSATVVWSAGVRGHPAVSRWGLPTVAGNRIAVRPTLQVPDHPEVFVAGDLAQIPESALPQTASAAIRQGQAVANNILRQMNGQPPLLLPHKPPRIFATVGRRVAAACRGDQVITGLAGWTLWAGNHIFGLVRENRAGALWRWAGRHFSSDRGTRLIVPAEMEPGIEQLAIFNNSETH